MNQTTFAEWWRPNAAPAPFEVERADRAGVSGSRFAYRAVLAFTIVLVIAPQDLIPALAPLRLAMLTGVSALVAALIDRYRHPDPTWRTPREFVFAGALLGLAVLMVPLSRWPGGSVSALTDHFLKSLIVFWLIGRVVNSAGRVYRLVWTLSLLSVPVALGGLKNYRAGTFMDDAASRIAGYGHGLAANPNDLALTLAIILPLTFALVLCATTMGQRLAASVIALLSVAAIIVTFSRGGFVALAVIVVLTGLWLIHRGAILPVAAAIGVLMFIPPLLPAGYVERIQTMADVNSDPTGSAQDRWRDTVTAARLIAEHPVVGAGIGMDILALNEARGTTWRSVHDVYLQYGVDLGVAGTVLFVLLLGSAILTARRAEREGIRRKLDDRMTAIAGAVKISLLAFAVAALFYPVAYYFYFYYLAGLAVALRTTSGSVTP